MILIMYVNGLFITKNHTTQIKWIMSQLKTKFEMNNISYLNFYLGVEFLSVNRGIFMRQKNNMRRMFEQFDANDYNPAQTPLANGFKLEKDEALDPINLTIFHQIIAKVIYLTNIFPYILFVVSIIN